MPNDSITSDIIINATPKPCIYVVGLSISRSGSATSTLRTDSRCPRRRPFGETRTRIKRPRSS